jgi:hypothetical protein
MNHQNRWWLTIVAGLLLASPVQARSLTLGCSGTLTTTHVSKSGTESDPEKESIKDFSVVIDFDQRTVSVSAPWMHGPFSITGSDANSVTFSGSTDLGPGFIGHIGGTIDRITGKFDATERWPSPGDVDITSITSWDLRCQPTRRLF